LDNFKNLIKDLSIAFPEIETSFRENFSAYYIIREFPKSVNERIGVHRERKLYSLVSFGANNTDFNESPDRVKISISISFTIYETEGASYARVLPHGAKLVHCPRSFDITDEVTFSETTGKFYRNGRVLDLVKYLKEKIRRNESVLLPFRGLFERFVRRLRWYLVAPLAGFFSATFVSLFYLATGKRLLPEKREHHYVYLSAGTEAEQLVVESGLSEDKKVTEIDFFGMKVKPAPLITYASLNLVGYLILYSLSFKPPILKTLFENTFLSILYVVVTYSLLEFGFGKIFHWLSQRTLDLKNAMKVPEKQGYVR
jgi:hypothetical protein